MYELALPNIDIVAEDNQIRLIGYEHLNKSLDQLGEYLTSVTVTPENIKESKRLVAQVRKACKTLNEQRIAFKKEYLKPLETLEHQVKELDNKASGFEETVRVQIRELEEQERENKEKEIFLLFDKRLKKYGSKDLYPFEQFLKREYLNKSTSMNKIEDEMVAWLEKRRNDLNALIGYSETIPQDRDTVITEYLNRQDVSETISYFTRLNERKEQVAQAVQNAPKRAKDPQPATSKLIRVKEDDVDRVVQLLKASQIDFELV